MASTQEHHLSVTRQARYFTLGNPDAAKEVWFVLHGYGQLAQYFIQPFRSIHRPDQLIVAPEGLSKFYLTDFSGRVGATWMTKEDRLTEIDDYVNYLNQLGQHILGLLSKPPEKIGVLGFSQGVSTAMRWVITGNFICDQLILWAGSLPPEIILGQHLHRFEDMEMTLVIGDEDQFANQEVWNERLAFLEMSNIPFHSIVFNGKHRLDTATLERIL